MEESLIYITEDDADIREMEKYALTNSGFSVEGFSDGKSMTERCKEVLPDLILLDIMLPGEDGLSLLKRLRDCEATASIPVMLVSAKSMEIDKVKGLDLGADDYLVKPFGIMELVSRVKALLRRSKAPGTRGPLRCGQLCLDDSKHLVTAGGAVVELTFKEYKLLAYLMENKGYVLSREKIMDKVWGFDYEGESRTVDMHIKTLRQKLGELGKMIRTVRNVGYQLEEE